MTAVWASPQLDPAGVLIHFILGLVAAFNLSARRHSCCKLAENCVHAGQTVCNPFQCKRVFPMPRKCAGQERPRLSPVPGGSPPKTPDTFRSLAWLLACKFYPPHSTSSQALATRRQAPVTRAWPRDPSTWRFTLILERGGTFLPKEAGSGLPSPDPRRAWPQATPPASHMGWCHQR